MTTFSHHGSQTGTFRSSALDAQAGSLEIRAGRIALRPMCDSDRVEFTALLRECRGPMEEFFPLHRPGETDEQVFERQALFARAAQTTGRAWRRLIRLESGVIAGAINLNDLAGAPDRNAELNIWLAPRFQGRGIGREAMAAVVDHALRPAPSGLGLERVWAYIAPDNAPCLRLFYKSGFARDRDAVTVQLNLAGRWKTHHAYQQRRATA